VIQSYRNEPDSVIDNERNTGCADFRSGLQQYPPALKEVWIIFFLFLRCFAYCYKTNNRLGMFQPPKLKL
jgi:hypothetical protein